MSLINDAIKQANKANKDRTASAPASGTPPTAGMQTAEARPPAAARGSMTGMFLIAGIVVFVLLGGALLFLAMRNNNPDSATASTPRNPGPAAASAPAEIIATPTLESAIPTQAAQLPQGQAAAATPGLATTTAPAVGPTAPVTVTAPVVEVASKPAGPRAFPELKLQGIYYRIKDPSVMINGKTLMIGDLVSDVTVTKIERKDVTVELDGQQKVLRLQ